MRALADVRGLCKRLAESGASWQSARGCGRCGLGRGFRAACGVAAYAAVRALEAILFRSCFDSAEARQTVRWGCFWSLEFALENGAATESNAAGFATVGRCGVGASTMVFWGWRGSAGIRSAPVRGCGMRNKRSLGRRSRFGVNHSGRCPFFAGRKAGLCFAVCFDFQPLACGRPGFENRRASIVFRSCFDSAEARQTVRWGRFWGLLFAPGFGAGSKACEVQSKSNPARTQPEPSPNLVQTQMGFRRLAYALCLRDELGFALSRLRHGCGKPRFWSPLSAGP